MKSKTTRRDFLKLSGTLPLGIVLSNTLQSLNIPQQASNNGQNFLVVVFDAFSAQHISMYGYQRETTPYLAKLSEQAIVYHNHYANGNFTVSGTGSLLTGTLPWTHRALQNKGTLAEPFTTRNIFSALKNHYGIAYTHNPWAHILLEQCEGVMDELVPRLSLFLKSYDEIIHKAFKKDDDIASVSWLRNTDVYEEGFSYSLFLSHIYEALQERNFASLRKEYPRGIPTIGKVENYFLLDQAVDWINDRLTQIPQPFLGYFHFLPPHGPYYTSIEYIDKFARDNYKPPAKPWDGFSDGRTEEELLKFRTHYDEFILYTDNQFNILFERLRDSGLLENTWVIFTSDHGEMFERGIIEHSTDAMYEPILRVPLMIFEPGRTKGENIYTPTSAIDVLPTLAHLSGNEIPDWGEGNVLPPFAGQGGPDMNRSIYAIRALRTGEKDPITRTSIALVKNGYKLHYYQGYTDLNLPAEIVRLYNIQSDPEEMVDLADTHKEIASELLAEIKRKLDEANQPYL